MKRFIIIVSLFVLLFLTACSDDYKEAHSVKIGTDDAVLKIVVKKFVVPYEMNVSELADHFEQNSEYASGAFRDYLLITSDYYSRISSVLDDFKASYFEQCPLSETGCINVLGPSMKALSFHPKEEIVDLEVLDEVGDKASVKLVSDIGGSEKVQTFYLNRTEDGWKVYDAFDYSSKTAVSDLSPEEISSQYDLQVFRIRSSLDGVGFDVSAYNADVCVTKFGQDYLIDSDSNKEAINCYNENYYSKDDPSFCSDIFPLRFRSICYGVTIAKSGENCSIIVNKPAYVSHTYGLLSTEDVCNFYYSMEMGNVDASKAAQNCLKITNEAYAKKCISFFYDADTPEVV